MQQAVAYYRVSTAHQGRSGLGIEAQRASVTRFAEQEGFELTAAFVEAETGKGADALDRRRSSQPGKPGSVRSSSPSSTGSPVTSPSLPA